MRTIITFALCLSLFTASYSQDKKANKNSETKIEELPEVVVSSIKNDFAKYIPDNNPDVIVRKTQNEFVAYTVDEDYKDFDTYLVTLKNSKGSLIATYNQKGMLMSVEEKYVNVELPRELMKTVYLAYPEWTVTRSKFVYSQEKGQILKKAYLLKLQKNNKTQNILVSSIGEIKIANLEELAMN
ncbi:hypothetical protein [Flavobacterium aquicola]|uniref:Nicotinate-nucleotide adenylyltransferase n=1 Tax=Flavobacterium aquicola TaxID=1682742 RepID=A0A3E0E1M0_9FLAO|nr:hypothetical protein [Flavobacterium aquicola]REG90816.1 hypothetical protein C8P67_11828 [Flavobacterium aquicola]